MFKKASPRSTMNDLSTQCLVFKIFLRTYFLYSRQAMVIWSDPPGEAVFHPNEGHMPWVGMPHIVQSMAGLCCRWWQRGGAYTDTPCFAHEIHLQAYGLWSSIALQHICVASLCVQSWLLCRVCCAERNMPRFAPLGLTWQAASALEVFAQTRSLPGMAIREHTQLGVILEVWPGRVPLRQAPVRGHFACTLVWHW